MGGQDLERRAGLRPRRVAGDLRGRDVRLQHLQVVQLAQHVLDPLHRADLRRRAR